MTRFLGVLRNQFSRGKEQPTQSALGYFLLTQKDQSRWHELGPGAVLDNMTDDPPWIVVFPELNNVSVPNWPINLWKVETLKAVQPQGHTGDYTRCSAVRVMERVPGYRVFGETDIGIGDVLDFAQRVTRAQAQKLSELRTDTAAQIYSGAWSRWCQQIGVPQNGHSDDFADVLSVGRSYGVSPIGPGLLLMSRVVFDQAGRVDAQSAYAYSNDGTPYLTGYWDAACATFKDAALSFGASELFDQPDLAILRLPLREVAPELVERIESKLG